MQRLVLTLNECLSWLLCFLQGNKVRLRKRKKLKEDGKSEEADHEACFPGINFGPKGTLGALTSDSDSSDVEYRDFRVGLKLKKLQLRVRMTALLLLLKITEVGILLWQLFSLKKMSSSCNYQILVRRISLSSFKILVTMSNDVSNILKAENENYLLKKSTICTRIKCMKDCHFILHFRY